MGRVARELAFDYCVTAVTALDVRLSGLLTGVTGQFQVRRVPGRSSRL